MSVAATAVLATGTGNGSTQAFAFSFPINAESELLVYLEDTAGGNVFTLQTITTHYTVSFDQEAETGTVTFVTAPGSGKDVVILRSTPKTQGDSLTREGGFPSETLEEMIDKVTRVVQELAEKVDRAAVQPAVPANPAEVIVDAPTDGKLTYWALESGKYHLKSSSVDATV